MIAFTVLLVRQFGQHSRNGTFSALGNNSFLISNTILYCITENQGYPHVTWTYTDISGYTTVLSATTDATTGVSSLNVTNDMPGHYRCEVTENGGDTRTYTAVMVKPGNYMIFMCVLETRFLEYKLFV